MKTDNSSFERAEQFKYLGATLTYQNFIQEETKGRLMSGNACYHSVQNLLSSSLLSKNLKIKIYRTVILHVFYGRETSGEECGLRLFENGVLRRIFWPKRNEVKEKWRKLQNEELNELYSSPSIIRLIKSRRMTWSGHVARMGERRRVYMVLVCTPVGIRPLGRSRRRWDANIKMYLQEVGWGHGRD
jgi:hypothetical protein